MPEPASRLRELLSAEPPPAVAALPAEAQDALASLIADARRRQAADLRAALEATLRHVPLPLRGAVRRVVL